MWVTVQARSGCRYLVLHFRLQPLAGPRRRRSSGDYLFAKAPGCVTGDRPPVCWILTSVGVGPRPARVPDRCCRFRAVRIVSTRPVARR